MAGTAISFAGTSLQTANIFTAEIQHENAGTRLAIPYIIAHSDGSVIPFTEYSSKMVTIQGTIQGTSVSDCDVQLDAFRAVLTGNAQNLDIGYAGSTRRYIATATDVQIQRPGGLNWAKFTVQFICLNAFGQSTTLATLVNATGVTAGSRTDTVTLIGSAPRQLPVATLTLHTFTGSGNQTINFGNNSNGQQITISRVFTAGDVILIDSVQHAVFANSAPIDFAGAFVELGPGLQSFGYSDSFTARNFDYNIGYYPRYI